MVLVPDSANPTPAPLIQTLSVAMGCLVVQNIQNSVDLFGDLHFKCHETKMPWSQSLFYINQQITLTAI